MGDEGDAFHTKSKVGELVRIRVSGAVSPKFHKYDILHGRISLTSMLRLYLTPPFAAAKQ